MKKKAVKLTKKAEIMPKHMEIHSIKNLVLSTQFDLVAEMLVLADTIDPAEGREKTYHAEREAGYPIGCGCGYSTGYRDAMSNGVEGYFCSVS